MRVPGFLRNVEPGLLFTERSPQYVARIEGMTRPHEFKPFVPRWFRYWLLTKTKKKGAHEPLYESNVVAWLYSQQRGRINAFDGYQSLWTPDQITLVEIHRK